MTEYVVTTERAALPVALSDVKNFLRITDTSDDSLLTILIHTAADLFEGFTHRTLINTTFTAYIDDFPVENYIELRRSKLVSVTSVKYYIDAVLTTLDSAEYYTTNSDDYSRIHMVDDDSFPTTDTDRVQTVQVEFVAGYGASDLDIPYSIKSALMSHIAWLYENRGSSSDCSGNIPEHVKRSYMKYKIIEFVANGL